MSHCWYVCSVYFDDLNDSRGCKQISLKFNVGSGLCVSGIVIEIRAERFMHISHAYPMSSGCE